MGDPSSPAPRARGASAPPAPSWSRTKMELFASCPWACRDDALIVAEDVLGRGGAVVKRFAAAAEPAAYLDLLYGAAGRGARHRYEVLQSMSTPVLAFFDVDLPAAPELHAGVEARVRADLEEHFGLPPGSRALVLSSSHTASKASVHAVARFRTTMAELKADAAALRGRSAVGAGYDDIYNRFRCFRAVGSSKHPGASGVARPELRPCACSPADPALHSVRAIAGPFGDIPTGSPAALLRLAASPGPARPLLPAGGAGRAPSAASCADERRLIRAAHASGIASEVGIGAGGALRFDRVSVVARVNGASVRGELARRTFVCPGKGSAHYRNRAVIELTRTFGGGRRTVRFCCLDSECRRRNRASVILRELPASEPQDDPAPSKQ